MTNPIPLDELQSRLKKLRDAMRQHELDAMVVYSQKRGHIAYLSGYHPNYHTNSALMLITPDHEPTLWIKFAFDLPRAKATSWLEDVRVCSSEHFEEMIEKCAKEICSLGLESSQIGLAGADLAIDEMSASFDKHIRSQLPRARLVPASDLVTELRLIKTQNEIAILREASQLAERAADSLRRTIKSGIKDRQAVVSAEHAAKLEGADHCDVIISTDRARHALPPCGLEFNKGSAVNFEITVRYGGYWVQMCRVFSIGKPSQAQAHVFEVCRGAYGAAVRAARPGTYVAELQQAAHGAIAVGCLTKYIQYGTGHGVGLDLPELYPVDHECQARLAAGMVFVIHPAIWAPNQGAAFIGGPIAVTEKEALPLDNPVSELIVI
jgi:Xaa-Pro aminopeptidase